MRDIVLALVSKSTEGYLGDTPYLLVMRNVYETLIFERNSQQ